MLSSESRRVAGILLVVFPTVLYGGVSLLMFLLDRNSGYMENPLRQNLFRAGHAHAGVLLVLSLVALRYCGRGQPVRGMEAVCARFHTFRRHLLAGSIFLLCAFSLRQGTQRIHLPRLRGSSSSGAGLIGAGSGPAEEFSRLICRFA